jgi:hypothetical protein
MGVLIMKEITVYEFMSENADRRTRQYKNLEIELDSLVHRFGKESNEVKEFFNRKIQSNESKI